jgi:nitrogen fixation/metabolism regulation signal transduction histidine kinase
MFDSKARKLKNFLLEPMVQVKIGIYCIICSLLFAVTMVSLIYFKFNTLARNILDLTDVPDELLDIIQQHWSGTGLWIAGLVMLYILVIIVVSIWYTHRLVGPMVAFNRHVDKLICGDYQVKTTVRKHDAFGALAEKLNKLSDSLSSKHAQK